MRDRLKNVIIGVTIVMDNNLGQVIDITAQRAKYDTYVKEILSDKQILARILKYTLDEFKDTNLDTIVANIGEPYISSIYTRPGLTNTEKVSRDSEEDSIPGEGKATFDIRFSAYAGEELIKVLINIEAQKSSKPYKLGYHLDNRIIFYLSRMISSQKEVEFSKSDYDNIKAVRSIWICMDSASDEASINRIVLSQDTLFGKDAFLPNLHKVQGVIIRLRSDENSEKTKNELIDMLEELLRKDSPDLKKQKLLDDYKLKLSDATERRLGEMCNLSEVLVERSEKQGFERGDKHGFERGDKHGFERGELSGKVKARFEDGMSIEKIAEKSNVAVDIVTEILKENGLI